MKRIFTLLAIAMLLCFGCNDKYDDTELRNSINSLEQRISAMETVMKAYKGNLFIQSVEGTENGYTIIFSDGSQATIVNGKDGVDGKPGVDGIDGNSGADGKNGVDGKPGIDGTDGKDGVDGKPGTDGKDGIDGVNGETLIESIIIGEEEVTFRLTDGRTFSIPLYSSLSITFGGKDTLVVAANSTCDIAYTVRSVTNQAVVEVASSADLKAKVVAVDKSGLSGKIQVTTGTTIDEYSKVIVFVSNGEKVIMRSITFEEVGLKVEDNAVKNVSAKGEEVTLEFLTNMECHAVIPEETQSWISVVPETRAMEKRSITLKLEANKGHNRSAIVKVEAVDGSLKLEYRIEQSGDLGILDIEAIPDDEIWYTTINAKLIYEYSGFESKVGHKPFDKNIVTHTYTNGLGIIKFDGPVNAINDRAMDAYGNTGCQQLENVYLPNKIKTIGRTAFGYQRYIEQFRVPDELESVDQGSFSSAKVKEFIGKNILTNGKGILVNGILYALSYDESIEEFVVPESVKELAPWLLNSYMRDFCVLPNVKRFIISEGVKKIGYGAFQSCKSLEYISLPSSLEDVDSYIFRGCPNIKEFAGNSKFVTSDHKCFLDGISVDGQMNLCIQTIAKGSFPADYVIPEGIVSIRPCAFEGCTNLRSITLPQSLLLIEGTFKDCPNFEYIYGNYASADNKCAIVRNALLLFAGKGIKKYATVDVTRLGSEVFAYQKDLEELVINDEVTNIGSFCFSYSPNLKSITLPKSLRVMRYDLFKGSDNLEQVYMRALTPPSFEGGGIEQTEYSRLTIYVPQQSLELYRNDAAWTPLRSYIKGFQYEDFGYVSTDYSQDGVVTTLQTATDGNGIDIVLMGDAYSDRQIADGTYRADMEYLYEHLFSEEPYKSFKHLFNVYYVNVVSATEGYGNGSTALSGFFGEGTRVGGDDKACLRYAQKVIDDERMDEALVVVAMNSDKYAGTCYMYWPTDGVGAYGRGTSVAYFPKCSDETTFAQILHHEACGHGFAKLADEYAYENMGAVPSSEAEQTKTQQVDWGWWKNVDFTNDLSSIRWNYFINDTRYANEGLGVYEGGLTYWTGVWRPTENSIMRHNTGGFNAPSREAIYYRIHKLAYGDSWEYNYEDFVQYDAVNRTAAATAARSAAAYKPANYRPLHPPVVRNKSWREAE